MDAGELRSQVYALLREREELTLLLRQGDATLHSTQEELRDLRRERDLLIQGAVRDAAMIDRLQAEVENWRSMGGGSSSQMPHSSR